MKIKGVSRLILAAGLALVVAAPVTAATWTKVGSSGFTTNPALLQDWWKPVFNTIAFDDAGNIYVSANNGNNRGVAGGITIFKAGGGKLDIDLNAAGFPGAVTKMVKAGDGKIYAVQNWREAWEQILTGGATIANVRQYGGSGIPGRILQIDSSGNVTLIYEANDRWDGLWTDIQAHSIVDIDATNKGIQTVDTNSGKAWSRYYTLHRDSACTAGARFRITEYTLDATYYTCVMELRPYGNPVPALGIFIGDDDHLWLGHAYYLPTPSKNELIQDLGPIDTDAYYEVYLYIDAATNEAKVKFNGTEYSFTISDPTRFYKSTGFVNNGHAQWGAGTSNGRGGTSTVIFDWFGYGEGYITTSGGEWKKFASGTPHLAPDGVTVIHNGLPQMFNNRINGIAVGDDGNVYFTQGTNLPYWKERYLWRYNVSTGEIEMAPGQPVNNGWNEVRFLYDLANVGEDQIAILNQQGPEWRLDLATWTIPPEANPQRNRHVGALATGSYNPTWARAYPTAWAYDPIRNKFWQGGWSVPAEHIWAETAAGGTVATITDLGGGNQGLTLQKNGDAGYHFYTLYRRMRNVIPGVGAVMVPAYTMAARFSVDSLSGCDNVQFMLTRPLNPAAVGLNPAYYAPQASIGVHYVDGVPNYALMVRRLDGTEVILATMGPVVPGQFNEVYLYNENSVEGTDRFVKCWWNGVQVFNGAIPDADCRNGSVESWAQFGSDMGNFRPTVPGSNQVTFDWVGIVRGEVSPSMSVHWDHYLDGSLRANDLVYALKSNLLSVVSGVVGSSRLLEPEWYASPNSIARAQSVIYWHANNHNPQVLDHLRLRGSYWFTGLAVNPADGKAWMSWSAEPTYDGPGLGYVITRDLSGNMADEGIPEAGAIVAALAYNDGKMYALTCNLTTGVYSLYSTDVPMPGPMSVGAIKNSPVGTYFETDTPKLVTWPDVDPGATSFYIQDDDRSSGIRVIGQPVAKLGQRAAVKGFLAVLNGEAVIYATEIVASATADTAEPLAMTVRSVGGGALGVQPATFAGDALDNLLPSNLNTTGLLIRVAGKLVVDGYDEFIDDGSGFPLRIDWPSGTGGSDGDPIAVTGVSTVNWDSVAQKGFRVITPRKDSDIDLY